MHLPSIDTVAGGITAFFTLMAAVIGGAMKVAQVLRKRDERRMASVPPTQVAPAVERRLDTLERIVAEQAKWDAAELRRELAEAIKERDEARLDAYQAQQALAAERLRAARYKQELERLRARS